MSRLEIELYVSRSNTFKRKKLRWLNKLQVLYCTLILTQIMISIKLYIERLFANFCQLSLFVCKNMDTYRTTTFSKVYFYEKKYFDIQTKFYAFMQFITISLSRVTNLHEIYADSDWYLCFLRVLWWGTWIQTFVVSIFLEMCWMCNVQIQRQCSFSSSSTPLGH